MKEFVFSGEQGEKLTRCLGRVFPELGRSYLLELLRKKDIKINGKRVSKDTPLLYGDKIEVYADQKRLQDISVKEVLKTADIAVYVKPRGITTEEFANKVSAILNGSRVCHRLDTNTAGLLVFTLNETAYEIVKDGFKQNYINKHYIARVVGNLRKEVRLNAFLLKDDKKGMVKILNEKTQGAVSIITGIKPLSYDKQEDTSLVEVELITGKTHQIRAHLAFIGHPIVGDPKYGNFMFNRKAGKDKQLLCAYRMSFSFPPQSKLYYLNKKDISIDPDFN